MGVLICMISSNPISFRFTISLVHISCRLCVFFSSGPWFFQGAFWLDLNANPQWWSYLYCLGGGASASGAAQWKGGGGAEMSSATGGVRPSRLPLQLSLQNGVFADTGGMAGEWEGSIWGRDLWTWPQGRASASFALPTLSLKVLSSPYQIFILFQSYECQPKRTALKCQLSRAIKITCVGVQ